MFKNKETNIQKLQTAYVFEYPDFAKMADEQMEIFWPWSEIKVEKDKHDLLTNLTEAEYHGVVTTLKLFTKYELFVGTEYWGGRVMKMFSRPEIHRMASCFAHVELNSHAPFYSRINEELGLASEEFYNSYVDDPILAERMEWIGNLIDHKNDLVSLAGFSFTEGAILYSQFAYLKHFQSQGKNKMANVGRGILMSVRDENFHSMGGAALFNQVKLESNLTEAEELELQSVIYSLAHKVREHEYRIAEMVFEKAQDGKMEGITLTQMKHFIDSRVNTCLEQINYKKLFDVKYNPIADWFYDGINKYAMNDFFQGVGREYTRNWEETGFTWEVK